MNNAPVVELFGDVWVVRDDLYPGGTKARFIPVLFAGAHEVVYGSPAEGGAQTALAVTAQRLGRRATIFVAKRAKMHPRTADAKARGAKIVEVAPGHLSVVKARAKTYCKHTGAFLAPFGLDLPAAVALIADAARATAEKPDEVWCAAGSGVLARALAAAWPQARRHVVQVGRALTPSEVAGATIHVHPLPFGKAAANQPPFPSDRHYDAKAWEVCRRRHGSGRVLFWNVTGPVG